MTPQSSALSPLQEQVAAALASGSSIAAAARAHSTSRQTIHNWLQQSPAFSQALNDLRAAYQLQLQSRFTQLAARAIDKLESLLDHPDAPPSVQLRASLAILNHSLAPAPAAAALPNLTLLDTCEEISAPQPPLQNEANPPALPAPLPLAPTTSRQTPRNALCPCRSGLKFKRCCGKEAPPVLTTPRAA